jgi:hypothetical protein
MELTERLESQKRSALFALVVLGHLLEADIYSDMNDHVCIRAFHGR